jgi:hypothetical protein
MKCFKCLEERGYLAEKTLWLSHFFYFFKRSCFLRALGLESRRPICSEKLNLEINVE